MPVPSSMGDLSVTESSNSPSGSDAISTGLDNYLRAIQAIVRSTNHKGADIASAASVAIGASAGEFVTVTGTTTITSFDSVSAGIVRTVHFSDALTITNSSNIQMPGGVNYTTTAGDVAVFRSLGSGQWRCVSLLRYQNPAPTEIPALQRLTKTSTTSRTSTTIPAVDPDLASFTIEATKSYRFKLSLVVSGAPPGFKFELRDSASGSLGLFRAVSMFFDGGTLGSTGIEGDILPYATATALYPTGAADAYILVEGFVRGHATLNRNLGLYWAQASSSASPTSLKDSSFFELQEF